MNLTRESVLKISVYYYKEFNDILIVLVIVSGNSNRQLNISFEEMSEVYRNDTDKREYLREIVKRELKLKNLDDLEQSRLL